MAHTSVALSAGFASLVPCCTSRSSARCPLVGSQATPGCRKGLPKICNLVYSTGRFRQPRESSPGLMGRSFCAKAVSSNDNESNNSIAPMEPESPTGQFLVSMLENHPHLFPAAADQQLVQLAADRDAAQQQETGGQPGTDIVLHRRIADLKAEERRKAVEEVIYALIVQKFVDAGVTMVRKLPSAANDSAAVEISPSQETKLEAVHTTEALEMVRQHLTVFLGGKGSSSFLDSHTIAHISKLRVGQVYAASTMYGYFLRRVDQRFQLEKNMKALAVVSVETFDAESRNNISSVSSDSDTTEGDELAAEAAAAVAALNSVRRRDDSFSRGSQGGKSSPLRSYVMSFDAVTLNRCATMRAKESLNVIEKHAEALFGKPEIRIAPDGTFTVASDDTIRISFSGLRRLVLEAVAFGSFLWDVESYVDSMYGLVRP